MAAAIPPMAAASARRPHQRVGLCPRTENGKRDRQCVWGRLKNTPFMNFDRKIAHFVVQRRRTVFALVGLLLAVCAVLLALFLRLDSEILNLLPDRFESVRALKAYNTEFTQSRELTFGLLDEKRETDLDGFREHFCEALRAEPWVERVLDRSPVESEQGMREVTAIALPLLMNLPPEEFKTLLARLAPDSIAARFQKMRASMEAGSPRAEMELSFDPLGLIGPALKPLAGSFSIEQTRPLASPDGTLQLVMVMTKQEGLGPKDCQKLMEQVREFNRRVTADWQEKAPSVIVTGRTPYVAEMSAGMEHDIFSTLISSLVLVSGLFYLGFRRFGPLVAILHVLLLCCLVAVTVGGFIFQQLNGITIGFCSILVGLGFDFGMLLFSNYQRHRTAGLDHEEAIANAIGTLRKGIFFGAITTAAAFLILTRSGCPGFAQLGVLIAVGITFSGALMLTLFFSLVPRRFKPGAEAFSGAMERYVDSVFQAPGRIFALTALLLVGLGAVAILPVGKLDFQANPRALEPENSSAASARRIISQKLSAAGSEPVLVLIQAGDAQEFHQRWEKAQSHWAGLMAKGELRNISSPVAFALSPDRFAANRASLAMVDLAAAESAVAGALESNGFSKEAFAGAFNLLRGLGGVQRGEEYHWRTALPASSVWWFVFDKFLSSKAHLGAAYLSPARTIESPEEQAAFRKKVEVAGVPMQVSGWSYMLAELTPWAKRELVELTSLMLALNIALLLFLYRKLAPLLLLMGGLLLTIGAMIACVKLLEIPLNLFNVLALPLVLGVGVDYGIYVLLALRDPAGPRHGLSAIAMPVLLSGLTTAAGFGSLASAYNPALRGLGIVCALGVFWCLVATFLFIVPVYVWRRYR